MSLIKHFTEHTSYHSHQIVDYVQNQFQITYTVAGMNKWLHHNGFLYKQPKAIPHKFNPEVQEGFIQHYLVGTFSDEIILL